MDLLEACENGNEERVVELLLEAGPSKAPALLRQVDQAGRGALHVACIGGQLAVVRLLLGRECQVYFPGRSREDVEDLIVPCGNNIRVVMKRKEDAHVPSALLQLPADVVVQPHDLANGTKYLDHYGNAPIQCISCFGCGSEMKHVRDSVEIAAELLRSGCQCNTSKTANNWTPLHWSAFNGHHELTALMLNPRLCFDDQTKPVPADQFAVPLVRSEGLYPVDIAGRMGLRLRDEMKAWRQSLATETSGAYSIDGLDIEYREWRLHLDHTLVVQVFVRDFITHAQLPGQYAKRVADCLDAATSTKTRTHRRKRPLPFSESDVVRYGQHLLYWCAGLNMLADAVALLDMQFTSDGATKRLAPLFPIEHDDTKSQSALHLACAEGHTDMVQTLLSRVIALYTTSLPKTASSLQSKVHPVLGTIHQRRISAKDVPFTALAGWLNHRLETPLYLAGLHNRADVSTALLSILPSSTIQTELHLQNIEGSTLQETAHDTVRTALNLPTSSSFPTEYVLVFRRQHRLFRKTLRDVLEEESSRAPSLLAATVGSRQQPRRWREPEAFDYMAIGATDVVLAQKAERMQLMVRRRGSTQMQVFQGGNKHEFEPFRSLQRQLVVLNLIRDNVNLARHLQKGTIYDVFPLHDLVGHNAIAAHWVLGRGNGWLLQPWASLRQYLRESPSHAYHMLWPLRTYFGDKHALYIAWIQFYTSYLLVVAIPCVIVEVMWATKTLPAAVPPLVMLVLVWITFLVERWKRKRAEILCNWGLPASDGGAASLVSAEFHGDFVVDTATNERDVQFPHAVHMLRIYFGAPLLLAMVVMAVMSFVGMKFLRAQQAASTVGVDDAAAYMPVISALNAVAIIVLDRLYSKVAYALTRWENHRTVSGFESMLAIKLFTFKFINAFMSLFWTAFVDREFDRLRYELFTILFFRQASSILMANLLPLFLARYRWRQRGLAVHQLFQTTAPPSSTPRHVPNSSASEDELRVPVGIEMQQLMATPYHILDKQIDAMIRFGYVTMFLTVFPSAPFLLVVTNTLEMHLDVQCSLEAYRRPSFDGGSEIPVFQSILEIMSFAAVTVNCALLYLTTDIHAYLPSSFFAADTATSTAKLWVLLGIEHLVLGIKAAMALGIADSPPWVDAYYAKLAKTQVNTPPPLIEVKPMDMGESERIGDVECPLEPNTVTTDAATFDSAPDDQAFALPPGGASSRSLLSANPSATSLKGQDASQNEDKSPVTSAQPDEANAQRLQDLHDQVAAMRAARDEALARVRVLESHATKQDDDRCRFCTRDVPCEVKCVECRAAMCRSCDAARHASETIRHIRLDVGRVGQVVQSRLAQVEQLLHLSRTT